MLVFPANKWKSRKYEAVLAIEFLLAFITEEYMGT